MKTNEFIVRKTILEEETAKNFLSHAKDYREYTQFEIFYLECIYNEWGITQIFFSDSKLNAFVRTGEYTEDIYRLSITRDSSVILEIDTQDEDGEEYTEYYRIELDSYDLAQPVYTEF